MAGEGGLLAVSAAFFTHQGHEVFQDPCPDLAAYRQAGRITPTIVEVDCLPDHILSAGLDLLDSSPPSSAGDILGMSFIVEYLPASLPPAVSRVDPVSLSAPFHGGSGGALAPLDRRLSHLSLSLREVCVLRGGVLNSIPSLKKTPHHALAISSHCLNMGGALLSVAVSLLCPSLPQWGMGGNMKVVVACSHHTLPSSFGSPPPRSPSFSEVYLLVPKLE